jgi:hypothetical protein
LLKTEVDSRDSHGGRARIKAARFPGAQNARRVRLRLPDQPAPRDALHLGQLDFLAGRENVVLLGPPGPGSH